MLDSSFKDHSKKLASEQLSEDLCFMELLDKKEPSSNYGISVFYIILTDLQLIP